MHAKLFAALSATVITAFATTAHAEMTPVKDRETFISMVAGKVLKRPFVELTVSADGKIAGKGARWEIDGKWSWQGGYFCRDLVWGGDDLGYNCQEVRAQGNTLRFTSDKGRGESADFRLR